MPSLDPALQARISDVAKQVDRYLDKLVPKTDRPESRLHDAMRHASLGGGKRLRPFMVISAAKMFNVADECAFRVAAAFEFVHCYSLIHDDLPAMDNSDTRRGKPTVHKQYDEATAILAGDALQALAFEIISDPLTHEDPKVRIMLVQALAKAAGASGLCGGQMLDILGTTTEFDIGTITRLQRMKTGELIAACCQAGAILGRASPAHYQALHNYAHDLGLAFQTVDDILDAEGDAERIGKPVGKDEKKANFVSILGIERARAQAEMLVNQAKAHLKIFDGRGADLEAVANFVVTRNT